MGRGGWEPWWSGRDWVAGRPLQSAAKGHEDGLSGWGRPGSLHRGETEVDEPVGDVAEVEVVCERVGEGRALRGAVLQGLLPELDAAAAVVDEGAQVDEAEVAPLGAALGEQLVLDVDKEVGARDEDVEDDRLDARADGKLHVLVDDAEEIEVQLGEPEGLPTLIWDGKEALGQHAPPVARRRAAGVDRAAGDGVPPRARPVAICAATERAAAERRLLVAAEHRLLLDEDDVGRPLPRQLAASVQVGGDDRLVRLRAQ